MGKEGRGADACDETDDDNNNNNNNNACMHVAS